jgi:hypothetical protein
VNSTYAISIYDGTGKLIANVPYDATVRNFWISEAQVSLATVVSYSVVDPTYTMAQLLLKSLTVIQHTTLTTTVALIPNTIVVATVTG